MQKLSERTANFTDSVIRRMTRIANEHGAINLSQGFPDFAPPKEITSRLSEIASDERFQQYSITWGAENFRNALAKKQSRFMGYEIDPNEDICVTSGSTEAMMAAMMSLLNPGDKVAIFSPFYENYGADAILTGCTPIYIPLVPPTYSFDMERVEDAFRSGAKAIIICNPSNPSGKVFTLEELTGISGIVRKYDAFVITDEVYEHIVYEPMRHTYISSLPGMRERTACCSSLSKTYSITGWRLGYTISSAEITDRIRKTHDFLTVGAAAPLQEAAVVGLNFGDGYYKWLKEEYARKRDLFLSGLDDIGIIHNTPEGAYYVMIDITPYGYDDDYEFAVDLIKEIGVASVPGSSFFREDERRYVRFHFAKKDETLKKAIERLSDIRKIKK